MSSTLYLAALKMKHTVFQHTIKWTGILFLLALIATPNYFCANIIPPEGGPKDSLPPRLMQSSPKDSTRNFKGNKVNFTFDEYIEIQDAQKNVIISPLTKNQPTVEGRLKNVSVKFRDSLEPNTTYTINFGNSIRDINEANVFKNFSYVFSTGNVIDSNSISGSVLNAETGKVDSTLIVVLHNKLTDSAAAKERPRYYAKVDGAGEFTFTNLPTGVFAIYAMDDKSGQKKYSSAKQLFAFADKNIVSNDNQPVELFAFAEEKEAITPARADAATINALAKAPLSFTTNLEAQKQDLLGKLELTFNKPIKNFDKSKIIFTEDSSTVVNDYKVEIDSTKKILSIIHPWKEDAKYRLLIDSNFVQDTSKSKGYARNDTLKFVGKNASEYGTVKLRFLNLDLKKNPVLQLVQNDIVVFSYPMTTNIWQTKMFKPGTYDIRILQDANKNGIWDKGNFYKHIQPEHCISIPQKLSVRSNWDNEVDVQ
jgi:hypothetical protein